MAQLHFDVCIFAGIVCRECGVALDSTRMFASKLKRHQVEQHANMELDHQREFKRLSALMEKCASSLLGYTTDAEKAQFCEMFLTHEGALVVWCSHQSCGRAYLDAQRHGGRSRSEHRKDGHFTPRFMKFPVLPSSPNKFFARDEWNLHSYEPKFSKFFQRAINAIKSKPDQMHVDSRMAAARQMQIRNENGMMLQRQPAGNQFQDEAHYFATELLHAVKPNGAGLMPKPAPVFTEFMEGQQSEHDLAFCFDGEEQFLKAAACYEREHVAALGGDHSQLLQFESDIGIRMYVCKALGGSYANLVRYASMYLSPPASSWEKCLEKAFFQFYHLANEQVSSLHPGVRKQLMVTGDGTGSLLLTKIVQGAN